MPKTLGPKTSLEILVVEDHPRLMEQAQSEYRAVAESGTKVKFTYATTLAEAKLAGKDFDGIDRKRNL